MCLRARQQRAARGRVGHRHQAEADRQLQRVDRQRADSGVAGRRELGKVGLQGLRGRGRRS
ncbi:hypothetical protein B4Q13_23525 [Lacticaseibacillus rhamnosus]